MELERTEDELIITRVIFENREYYQDTEEIIYNSDSQVENLKIISFKCKTIMELRNGKIINVSEEIIVKRNN